MQTVLCLNLCLESVSMSNLSRYSRIHTASSSHAAIKASYGLLKAEVEIPLRSSNVLLVWTASDFRSDMLLVDPR
jgi:hypothetical protein